LNICSASWKVVYKKYSKKNNDYSAEIQHASFAYILTNKIENT
jgi:hypothetical protein